MKRLTFCLAVLQLGWLLVGRLKVSAAAEAAPPGTVAPQAIEEKVRGLIEDFSEGHNGRSREACREVVQIGKPAVPYLAKALADPRKNVRWVSVEALGEIGGDEVLPALMAALHDEDKDVRRYAAWSLGKWGRGNAKAIAALGDALQDRHSEVVWHAMSALDQLGESGYKRDEHLVDVLCGRLREGDDDSRANAACALGMIGSPRACAPLVEALGRAKAPNRCRSAIAEALVKIGSRDPVPSLVGMLKDEAQDGNLRYRAAEILAALADPRVNADLLPLTKSSEPWLRQAAVRALGFKQNAAVVQRLAAIVADDKEQNQVREQAAQSLGRIGDPGAVDALAKAVVANDRRVRHTAAWALGETRSPKAVPILMAALKDPDCHVVMHAAQALGTIGDRQAAPAIVELFDRDDALMEVAASARFGSVAVVADLALEALMGEEPKSERVPVIRTPEQLREVRDAWRRKLGLQETQASERPAR